jgi:hypothetical protein
MTFSDLTLDDALARTDWTSLAQQKLALINTISMLRAATTYSIIYGGTLDAKALVKHLDGLLSWVDTIQDGADAAGHPVVGIMDIDAAARSFEAAA